MGEIRIVGPGETRGYPYPVCKNRFSQPDQDGQFFTKIIFAIFLFNLHGISYLTSGVICTETL